MPDHLLPYRRLQRLSSIDRHSYRTDQRRASRQSLSGTPGTHIGEVLLGKGRAALEQQIGYQPDLKTAVKRWVFRHASVFYLSSILLLSHPDSCFLSLAACLPELLASIPLSPGSSPWSIARTAGNAPLQWIVVLLLAFAVLIPVLTVATSLVNWLITLMIRPHILPKLDFKDEIPDPFQTLVVIPAMITSRKEIDSLAHQLELHYLRNPEPGLIFALLTDFSDADSESLPEDEDLVQYAIAAIEALNRKYGSLSSTDDSGRSPDDGNNRWQPDSFTSCIESGCGILPKESGWAGSASAASCMS